MLGVRGKGLMATLDGGRIGISFSRLWALPGRSGGDRCLRQGARKQFGRSISAFQNTQFELAEMKARVEAARSILVYAARFEEAAGHGRRKGPLQCRGCSG